MSTVTEFLSRKKVEFASFVHPPTFTSLEEARALGIEAGAVAKTLVLDTRDGHVLVVVPASRRLNLKLARDAVGDPHAQLAPEIEIERDFPSFELGAIPPIAPLVATPVFVDEELAAHDTVVFASGRQTESVRMRLDDLVRDPRVRIVALTRPAADDEDWME